MPAADADALGPRGRALFLELTARFPADPAAEVLILEAARIADRLDELNRILTGDGESWARIEVPDRDSDVMVLVVDRALGEARQQAIVFRQILVSLGVGKTDDSPTKSGGLSAYDQLAQRRAERVAGQSGTEAL